MLGWSSAGVDATNVAVLDQGTITAVTPAHSAGRVVVSVINPNAESARLLDGFRNVIDPTVIAVTPNRGSFLGGERVRVKGTNFVNGATVTFGGVAATGLVFVNAKAIDVLTPPHAAGTVDVAVTNPGAPVISLSNGFTYDSTLPGPSLATIAPASGPVAGGTLVTLTGTNSWRA